MRMWRVLLRISTQLQETGDIQAFDVPGFSRAAASHHSANRTN